MSSVDTRRIVGDEGDRGQPEQRENSSASSNHNVNVNEQAQLALAQLQKISFNTTAAQNFSSQLPALAGSDTRAPIPNRKECPCALQHPGK